MNFLLDANIYFAAIQDPRFLVRHRDDLLRIGPRTFLSSVVRAELLQGAKGEMGRARVNRATRNLERAGRVVPPTHDDWVTAGSVQGRIWDDDASLRSKRLLHDILIVCAARRVGAILITAMSASKPAASAGAHLVVPDELPFLESLSWFDAGWRELSALEMLQRYERGWRHRGVTAELSAEEAAFVRALIHRFGSELDVPA